MQRMGLDHTSGLQGEFRAAAAKLEKLADNAESRALVLQCRRDEKDYLLRRDEKYVTAAHQDLAKVEEFNRGKPKEKEAQADIAAYRAAFDALVAENRRLDTLEESMRTAIRKVEPALESLAAAGAERATAEVAQTQADCQRALKIAMGLALAALAAGVCIAVVLTRSITVPLRKSTHYAQEVASGAFDGTLAVDQKDELGVLAGSLRDMAANLKKMIAQTREQAERERQAEAERVADQQRRAEEERRRKDEEAAQERERLEQQRRARKSRPNATASRPNATGTRPRSFAARSTVCSKWSAPRPRAT